MHVETAIGQFTGTRTLLATELSAPSVACRSARRDRAGSRVGPRGDRRAHRLAAEPARPRRSRPAAGRREFGRKLALHPRHRGRPRRGARPRRGPARGASRTRSPRRRPDWTTATDATAGSAGCSTGWPPTAVDDDTIVGLCGRAMAETTEFVRAHDLVTVHDDPVEVIVMPEIHRGVAVAYCDPPGPLETAPLPTYFAVSPTPADWSAERVRSFFREYNAHMLHNLTVHEAMPGHVHQLAHNARYGSAVRCARHCGAGSFVEGWAVYAEELMVDAGYRGRGARRRAAHAAAEDAAADDHQRDPRRPGARARHDRGRGHAADDATRPPGGGRGGGQVAAGPAHHAQLSTYFVGYVEVRDLAQAWPPPGRERRCASVTTSCSRTAPRPPRHLRGLLGL